MKKLIHENDKYYCYELNDRIEIWGKMSCYIERRSVIGYTGEVGKKKMYKWLKII